MIRLISAVFIAALACAPKPPVMPTVSLRMTGDPPDARVTVDDEPVGTLDVVKARGVALPIGKHAISVEHDGYFPCDKLVEVKEGDPPVRFECKLVAVPD